MTAAAYAEALYSLAVEENAADEIYSQMEAVKFAFTDNPELSKLLDRPCADKQALISFIERCFGEANIYLLNCIKVMSKRRVTFHFPDMADEFMKLYRKENGIEIVKVITACAMEDEQAERLKAKLEKKLGRRVVLNMEVNPEILGGIIVRTENSQMDGSVKNRLVSIEKQIKSAVL